MHSLTPVIYLTAGMAIGILGLFAAHNRREGWRKTRTTLADALDDLYADLGLLPEAANAPNKNVVVPAQPRTVVDPGEFSFQLMNLDQALRESTSSAPAVIRQSEGELVAPQAR